MDKDLMTPAQLCEYLQIPLKTLRDWRLKGRGPLATRVGRSLRFRRKDVEDWLDQQADPRAKSA